MPLPATRTLTLLALLAGAAPSLAAEPAKATSAGAARVAEEEVDFEPERDPPQGSPADLALWKEARQTTFDILSSRREASRLQRHVRGQRLAERLDEAARARPHEEAERLTALRTRLKAGWSESYAVMGRPWPVDPTRGCGYPWLAFDSALRAAAAGSTRADVVTAQKDLAACVGKARPAVKEMQRSNGTFAATVAEVEAALAAGEPPGPAAAGAPAKAGAAKASEAERHEAGERHEHGAGRD
jgi:hypothetical protein